jgi:hypothetical protein
MASWEIPELNRGFNEKNTELNEGFPASLI